MIDGWFVFETAINLFQGCLMLYFMKSTVSMRRATQLSDALCAFCSGLFLTLYTALGWTFNDSIIFFIPLVYTLLTTDDKWWHALFWTVVMAALFLAAHNTIVAIYMSIPNVTWEQLMASTPLRFAFVVSSNLALLLIVFTVSKAKFGIKKVSWLSLSIFLIQNLIYLMIVEFMFTIRLQMPDVSDELVILVCLCVFACSLLSLVLFDVISKHIQKQARYQQELETMKMTMHHQDELKDVYTNMAIYRHDIKQQMEVLQQMVAKGNVPEANAYFEKLEESNKLLPAFATGNTAVDALLTAKSVHMKRHQIPFSFALYPMHELPIAEYEFCAVLGNMLDNAIEAICRMKERPPEANVTLTLSRARDMFYIICDNDVDPASLKKSGNLFWSDKRNAMERLGIGTQSISSITKRAQGWARFLEKGNRFKTVAVLPYGGKEKAA